MISKPRIGVMGSAGEDAMVNPDVVELAEKLGEAIARRECVLITGATTGLPDVASRAARRNGGLTIGISPAADLSEHRAMYRLPLDASDVIINTGFGLKGRNVINIRSSDIVIILGGGMGTLNEFTIAFDEGKIIGLVQGSGGIADHIGEIVDFAGKSSRAHVFTNSNPAELIEACLAALSGRQND